MPRKVTSWFELAALNEKKKKMHLPVNEEDDIKNGFLNTPDMSSAEPMSKAGVFWCQVLARLPFLHTAFWILMFGAVPLYSNSVWADTAHNIVSVWVIYGCFKFVTIAASCVVGLCRCYWGVQDRDWASMVPHNASVSFAETVHIVVIPNYKEPYETLARTLDTLCIQQNAKSIIVALAMESRDDNAHTTADMLIRNYEGNFKAMFYTVHKLSQGEVGGKSSNENWAMRCVKTRLVDEMALNEDNIIVTTCDADTYFHPHHFAYLSYSFCIDHRRYSRIWQACTCFYPNISEVPIICHARFVLLSITFLGSLVNPLQLSFPFSTYSLSLRLALRATYWDPTIIPEDWHMYLRCFYAVEGDVSVVPIYVPVGCECVMDETYWTSIVACYQQSKRWQWGGIDVAYILVQNIINHRTLPFFKATRVLFTAYEQHMMLNVMWFAIILVPLGQTNLDVDEAHTWNFYWLIKLFMGSWWMVNLVDTFYRKLLLQKRKHFHHDETWFSLRTMVAMLIAPISDLLFFVLPTCHAHLRMALSTNFTYIVAPKRSNSNSNLIQKAAHSQYLAIPPKTGETKVVLPVEFMPSPVKSLLVMT